MLKKMVKTGLKKIGYELHPIQNPKVESPGHVLYQYQNRDGSFDYDSYRRIQEEGNKGHIDSVWVIEENIAFLSEYIRTQIESPGFGICHGTRRGKEQEWFRKYIGCDVIGTEISSTATTFPHTIQWDFHEVKEEWVNAVDFIYSNSFDHSYDPEKCLNAWMSCVKKGGVCIIEHSSLHEPRGATSLDPFGAEIFLMPYLITKWGDGEYAVRRILSAPAMGDNVTYLNFIVIQRF